MCGHNLFFYISTVNPEMSFAIFFRYDAIKKKYFDGIAFRRNALIHSAKLSNDNIDAPLNQGEK